MDMTDAYGMMLCPKFRRLGCRHLICCLFVTAISSLSTLVITRVQPVPYMDEVFHVRQTKAYLVGNWTSWDDKITTPPGTYITFISLYRFISFVLPLPSSPTMLCFRFFNTFLCGLNFCVLSAILCLFGHCDSPLLPLVIITNPVLLFFSSLYYTDHCAFLFVLLSILSALSKHRFLSALFCAVGISIRQTNVSWLPLVVSILTSRRISGIVFKPNARADVGTWILTSVTLFVKHPIKLLVTVIVRSTFDIFWHFLVGLIFVCFVYWNQGVVLGDKAFHQAVFHVPQLWYFVLFCSAFTPLSFLTYTAQKTMRYRMMSAKSPVKFFLCVLLFLFLTVCIALSLRYLSYSHPYLLADNRHLTFYIWRKIIRRSVPVFYSLSLLYSICLYYWSSKLFSHVVPFHMFAIQVSVCLGTCMCLIPAGLLELRYFLIPYSLWRSFTFTKQDHFAPLLFELILNLALHVSVVCLFVNKPFYWPNQPGVLQRFMW
ncbi:unnamed protein product [Dicrocoelium dendriticum]|nr:unnamed protein product [Dicrocoelium dendriticum]